MTWIKEAKERLEECIKKQEARDKRILDGWKKLEDGTFIRWHIEEKFAFLQRIPSHKEDVILNGKEVMPL